MKRLRVLASGVLTLALLAGCYSQRVIERSFYEPTKDTLTKRADGFVCGAIKTEMTRSGVRDEGDKSYSLGLVNINE